MGFSKLLTKDTTRQIIWTLFLMYVVSRGIHSEIFQKVEPCSEDPYKRCSCMVNGSMFVSFCIETPEDYLDSMQRMRPPENTTHLLIRSPFHTHIELSKLSKLKVFLLDGRLILDPVYYHQIPYRFPWLSTLEHIRVYNTQWRFAGGKLLWNMSNLQEVSIYNVEFPNIGSFRRDGYLNRSNYYRNLRSLSLRKIGTYFPMYLVVDVLLPSDFLPVTDLDLSQNMINHVPLILAEKFPNAQQLNLSYTLLLHPEAWSYVYVPAQIIAVDISHLWESETQTRQLTTTDLLIFVVNRDHNGSNGSSTPSTSFGNTSLLPIKCGNITHLLQNTNPAYLDISGNPASKVNFDVYMILKNDRLEYLNLQDNEMDKMDMEIIFTHPSLKYIYLGGNDLGPSLMRHNVSAHNQIKSNIAILDLSHNSVSKIQKNFLDHVCKIRQLDLSWNSIKELSLDFSGQRELELVNLSYNELSCLSPEIQVHFDRRAKYRLQERNKTIMMDISGNPLSCGCKELDFVKWFQTTEVGIHKRNLQKCNHPFSGGIIDIINMDVDSTQQQCFPSYKRAIVLSTLGSTLATLLIVSAVVLYLKRWRLRYLWYLAQHSWRHRKEIADPNLYDYDVFVAYNWKDSKWVHGPLLQEMEEKRGLKLCIHQRDFIPGTVLSEIIVEKIQKSRKTLLVLSKSFIESNWCQFEVHMAQNRLFDEGINVIVAVILEPLPAGSINKTLYQVLKRDIYLEWPSAPEGRQLFWVKLAHAFNKNDQECQPFA